MEQKEIIKNIEDDCYIETYKFIDSIDIDDGYNLDEYYIQQSSIGFPDFE